MKAKQTGSVPSDLTGVRKVSGSLLALTMPLLTGVPRDLLQPLQAHAGLVA
jgi:hypothetical protein